ncbi:hypothetical protein COO91_03964 [Nostoc flagelliforme CCNUN1]|uniref:Uncharacterized protein n=1 Tax=Nostoc flagelliforme CCNUN1 TaxID=2038116 RepID=A0A2K8SRG0_9NOSO|nr:hypothetical protein COO91_03964 [Nostoc flagelliforme CCNUN1]
MDFGLPILDFGISAAQLSDRPMSQSNYFGFILNCKLLSLLS